MLHMIDKIGWSWLFSRHVASSLVLYVLLLIIDQLLINHFQQSVLLHIWGLILSVFYIAMIIRLLVANWRFRQSEQSYRSLFENHPDAIYSLDLYGRYKTGNASVEALTGWTIDELRQMTYADLTHPDCLQKVHRHFLMAAVHAEPQNYEMTLLHRDGHLIDISVTDVPIIVDGRIAGVSGIAQDITEHNRIKRALEESQRRLWEKLRESEESFRQLVEHSPNGVIIGRKDEWIYVNETVVKLLGGTDKKEVMKHTHELIHPDFREMSRERIERVELGETVELVEQKFIRLDGQVIDVEVKSILVIHHDEPAVHTIVRDITERKKAQELLQQSEKLSIAGQLAAGIAHEIRNPLTALKGFLQLMQSGFGHKQEYYDIMESELNRIEMIVSELLFLAKPTVATFKLQDVRTMLHQVLTLLDTQAIMNNVQIIVTCREDELYINCDENQIKQVFINFVKNAIEAMPKGGIIRIIVEHVADNVVISIKDQGCGIPADKLEKIGQPFFTTKQEGTGLGVMVSFNIVRNHKGKIDVESVVDEGTTFTVTLPIPVQNRQKTSDHLLPTVP